MKKLKKAVRWLLDRFGDRHRISDMRWYRLYTAVFFPKHVRTKAREKEFYQRLARDFGGDLAFDIGANVGSKTAIFADMFTRVVAVEPTPALVDILRKRFKNRRNVTIANRGVGRAEGTSTLRIHDADGALNTFSAKPCSTARTRTQAANSVEVQMTTLDELIRTFGRPSYIKIDVEGYERDVIRGLSGYIPLVSFEANLPAFGEETVECIELLTHRSASAIFNFVTQDPPSAFESSVWLQGPEMINLIRRTDVSYMEIFCRSDQSPPDPQVAAYRQRNG
jgi:FkbM family methyltransferase